MENVEVRIKRPPHGIPTPLDFDVVQGPAPQLRNGSFLCRARWLSLDPLVSDRSGDAEPLVAGAVVPSHGVCEIIESRHDIFSVGDCVVLPCGLQSLCISNGTRVQRLHPGQSPASTALGILGLPGMSAYFGLREVARVRSGETVLVSAASNAAGSMAGQIATLAEARPVGIAGSRDKCEWVTRHARFSACINYRTESLSARLKQLAPAGVDIYFDNTGGEVLETVIAGNHLAPGARVVLNSVSTKRYSASATVENLESLTTEIRARILRFDVREYEPRREEFLRHAIAWYGAGRLAYKEDIVHGLHAAPEHLCRLMRGENFGRALVRL